MAEANWLKNSTMEVPVEEYSDMKASISRMEQELATLRSQNAALLQALKQIEAAYWNQDDDEAPEMLRIAVDAIIASIKKGEERT